MKKLTLLAIAMVSATLLCQAQITKGSTFLGGSVNIYSNKEESTNSDVTRKATSWSLRPQLGKVIAENKVAGLFLNIGRSIDKQTSQPSNLAETKSSLYGGGVFYRRYYSLSRQFFLFGEGGLGVNWVKEDRRNNNGATNFIYHKTKSTDVNLSLIPGISFAATRKLHIEAGFSNLINLTYQTSSITEFSAPNTEHRRLKAQRFIANANANAFSSIILGLRWILPAK